MLRVALVGLGKMGISHQAIINSHPGVELVAVCDTARYVLNVLDKYTEVKTYTDYGKLLDELSLDAVVIATPTKLHASMIEQALNKDLHVFCEKPFVLDVNDGERLARLAESKGLVTQVGYHFRFVGAFQEAQRVVRSGALGTVHHVRAEAYGPVVVRPKGGTWRLVKKEGGGCLYDYACHALDLVNFVVGVPSAVSGAILNQVFSRDVEDEVYCSLHYANGATGQLAANWSDDSFRKMATKISVWGTNGRITADRQECQIYLRSTQAALPEMREGWTVRYTTELTPEVWYYLRGEEYSAQIEYFFRCIVEGRRENMNSFRSALEVDRLASMILAEHSGTAGDSAAERQGESSETQGILGRILSRIFRWIRHAD